MAWKDLNFGKLVWLLGLTVFLAEAAIARLTTGDEIDRAYRRHWTGSGSPSLSHRVSHPASRAEVACLARTLQGEAGNQGYTGMLKVAQVIMARVKSPQFPNTVCGVVRQGGNNKRTQFNGYWTNRRPSGMALQIAENVIRTRDSGEDFLYFKTVRNSGRIGVEHCASNRRIHGDHIFFTACDNTSRSQVAIRNTPPRRYRIASRR